MPRIVDPTTYASSPFVLANLSSYLTSYAGGVLNEPVWTTGSGSTVPYNKRMQLARSIAAGNNQYVANFALLLATMVNEELTLYAENNGQTNFYRWLVDTKPLELEYVFGSFGLLNDVGTQSGRAIFDMLAGIDNADMQ